MFNKDKDTITYTYNMSFICENAPKRKYKMYASLVYTNISIKLCYKYIYIDLLDFYYVPFYIKYSGIKFL